MTKFAVIKVAGVEHSSCPLYGSGGMCQIKDRFCPYGLTDVDTPEWCPLRDGPVEISRHGTRHARWHAATERDRLQEKS